MQTAVPAGRTLYTVVRAGLIDCLDPPVWLKSKTLLPGLVNNIEEKEPKYENWTPDEYRTYWTFAMGWLPTASISSVPNNSELLWAKMRWDKRRKKAVVVPCNSEDEYNRALQAEARMCAEACNLVASILESDPIPDDVYIPFCKAIEMSGGILNRKKLEKAIFHGHPVRVRSVKPSKKRRNVHIQDVLQLINSISDAGDAGEKATKMFGRF